ncbi:Mom family adenine methylcarbamoylation protein [Streptomyces sp. NPDC059373]
MATPDTHKIPYQQSLELSRLVLLDEVPANAESWFAARAFRLAAEAGVRAVIAHSAPHSRERRTPTGVEQLHPGHWGTIYQASGMAYLGRTRPRRLSEDGDPAVDTWPGRVARTTLPTAYQVARPAFARQPRRPALRSRSGSPGSRSRRGLSFDSKVSRV